MPFLAKALYFGVSPTHVHKDSLKLDGTTAMQCRGDRAPYYYVEYAFVQAGLLARGCGTPKLQGIRMYHRGTFHDVYRSLCYIHTYIVSRQVLSATQQLVLTDTHTDTDDNEAG